MEHQKQCPTTLNPSKTCHCKNEIGIHSKGTRSTQDHTSKYTCMGFQIRNPYNQNEIAKTDLRLRKPPTEVARGGSCGVAVRRRGEAVRWRWCGGAVVLGVKKTMNESEREWGISDFGARKWRRRRSGGAVVRWLWASTNEERRERMRAVCSDVLVLERSEEEEEQTNYKLKTFYVVYNTNDVNY